MNDVPAGTHSPKFSGKPLYALIDPWIREPSVIDMAFATPTTFDELEHVRSLAWNRPVYVCRDEEPLVDPTLAPYLVQLEGDSDEWCETLVGLAASQADDALSAQGGPFAMGGFIECALAPERLMERLQRMWGQVLGGRKRYVRIADPRVMELFVHLVEISELRSWLGPVHALHMRRRDGSWMCLKGLTNDDELETEAELYSRSERLESAQKSPTVIPLRGTGLRRVMLGEFVSRTLNELQRRGLLRDDSNESSFTAVEAALSHGLSHVDDVMAFALRHMSNAPDWTAGHCADAIASARREPGTFEMKLGETA